MHPLNPVLSSAVINAISDDRRDTAARAIATKGRSPFSGLRRRVAGRRGGPPLAMIGPRVPARARRA